MDTRMASFGGKTVPSYCKLLNKVPDTLWTMLDLGEPMTVGDAEENDLVDIDMTSPAVKKTAILCGSLIRILIRFAPGTLSRVLQVLHTSMDVFGKKDYHIVNVDGELWSLNKVDAYCLMLIAHIRNESREWDPAKKLIKKEAFKHTSVQMKLIGTAGRAWARFTNVSQVEDTYQYPTSSTVIDHQTRMELYEVITVFFSKALEMIVQIDTRTLSDMPTCPRCYQPRGEEMYLVKIAHMESSPLVRAFAKCPKCAESICGVTRVCDFNKLVDLDQNKRRRQSGEETVQEPARKKKKSTPKITQKESLRQATVYRDWLAINIVKFVKDYPELAELM